MFAMKQFQLLPSTRLLTRLVPATMRIRNGALEIGLDDLQIFITLVKEVKKVEGAMKLFTKRGKIVHETEHVSDGDEN